MQHSTKIFLVILLTSISACFIYGFILFSMIKNNIEADYISRYQSLVDIMGNTFNQMEKLVDQVNENAAKTIYQFDKYEGLPTKEKLTSLIKNLGITSFHIARSDGIFIRSTKSPTSDPEKSLYKICDDYRLLINGTQKIYKTPIIPDSFYDAPAKYTMIPNSSKTLILESVTELKYIGKIFHQAINSDKNIISIGFYTPSGLELGYISNNGEYRTGKNKLFPNLMLAEKNHKKMNQNSIIFNKKIPSNVENCCECRDKNILDQNGLYYYILKIEVSLNALQAQIFSLKFKFALLFLIILIISIILSRLLSKKLVSRIEMISKTADSIIQSGNFDLHVNIKKSNDEIGRLAHNFNKMIRALKIHKDQEIASQKMLETNALAAHVAHDIRSPIAVMEMTLHNISDKIPKSQQAILQEAIQTVRDIANNLLKRYRSTDNHTSNHGLKNNENESAHYVLLTSILESVVYQKRQEWCNNPCELKITVDKNAHMCWIFTTKSDLKRMLSNLLNNAFESLNKERKIFISLKKINNQLQLSISDSGTGIPAEKIDSVLIGKSLKQSGTGLGLSRARLFMEGIGGELILSSKHKRGTNVILYFPEMPGPIKEQFHT